MSCFEFSSATSCVSDFGIRISNLSTSFAPTRKDLQMSPTPTSLPSLTKLHDLLNLLAELRDLSNPFDTPASLKATLELLADLGSILGVNHELLNWLADVENNAPLLYLILSAGRFLESLVSPPSHPTPPTNT